MIRAEKKRILNGFSIEKSLKFSPLAPSALANGCFLPLTGVALKLTRLRERAFMRCENEATRAEKSVYVCGSCSFYRRS